MNYCDFIASKQIKLSNYGFNVSRSKLNPNLFDWQADIVKWALLRGRAALFEECGMGKTLQQLAWAEQVVMHSKKPVIIHCPIGVRSQTVREAERFNIGVPVKVANSADDIAMDGINLVNYEKLHKFDTSIFGGIVLDESSLLKNAQGKTKQQLIESYARTPYRLACTATPAPNDHMELGTHAEFLGTSSYMDMLSRYFVHDSANTASWRLRGHAVKDFWKWVSTWAICISRPSDLLGSDEGYILPPLTIERHYIERDDDSAPEGFLFNVASATATTIHSGRRGTLINRSKKARDIFESVDDYTIIWCDTNYESDSLTKMVPDAIEIRGSDSDDAKEEKIQSFSSGQVKCIITKPSITGFGVNWQHCNRQIFSGLSYSFESYYQAVRRSWRFGQTRPVGIHIIIAEGEASIESAIARKETDHLLMQSQMADAMRGFTLEELGKDKPKKKYVAKAEIKLPTFLQGNQ